MGFRKMFKELIATGGYTKAQLISRLDDIASYNATGNTIISTAEYDEIVAIINASSLDIGE